MDNNVLASEYGLQQIEKIIRLKLRVDFNQGLDARLVTDEVARLLAKVKWIKRIRFGCDTPGQIAECERATALIDKYGYKGEYFFYCILLNDFKESFERINHWRYKGSRFLPHAQPYRDFNNPRQIIPQWQNDLAGWADKSKFSEVVSSEILCHAKGLGVVSTFNKKQKRNHESNNNQTAVGISGSSRH